MNIRRWVPGSKVGAGVVVAVVCNLVLILALMWSRDGQTTDIRIEVVGDEFTVFVDGRERLRQAVPAPVQGGVLLFAPNAAYRPPTLPTDGEIELLRVSSIDGKTLYETSDVPTPPTSHPLLPRVAVDLRKMTLRDYAIDIRYHHTMEADIGVRVNGADRVTVSIRRWSLQGSPLVSLSSTKAPVRFLPVVSAPLEADAQQSAKGATAAVLRAYPLTIGLAILAILIGWMMTRVPASRQSLGTVNIPRGAHTLAVLALALGAFVISVYLLRVQLGGVPNVADEAAYIFQARILATGSTHIETPPIPTAFQFAFFPFLVDYGGRWASFYTVGHSVSLVPGVLVGAPWIMPPLLAAVSVVLMHRLALTVYGRWTALLAAALLASSPFFLMQASSYMAHNTSIAYMLAALVSLVSMRNRPYLSGGLGGVFFGLMFLTRPLPAVILAAPLCLLLVGSVVPQPTRRLRALRLAAFATAGVVMLLVYFVYNWSTTGNAFQNGYQASGNLESAFGFGGTHSVASGVDNEFSTTVALLMVLNGWPAWIGVAFVLAPFVLGTRNVFDWFFLGTAVLVIGSASLFYTTSMYNGPRYVYEAAPFLILLSARGFARLVEVSSAAVGERTADENATSVGLPHVIGSAAAIALVVASVLAWTLSKDSKTEILPIPPSAAFKADNGLFDHRLVEEARRQGIDNALVAVRPCFGFYRNCYLSVFLENNLQFDGEIVWIADQGDEKNQEVFALYPCRSLYVADYDERTFVATGVAPPSPGQSCD